MRRMSFALTTEQVRNQTKTVTRRKASTWRTLKAGDLLQPVEKCMGLKKGTKQRLIGPPIRVLSTRLEMLQLMAHDEPEKEGFPGMELGEFIELECKCNDCQPWDEVWRIEFEYTAPDGPSDGPVAASP